jgi:hypothetical protein
MWGMSTRPNGNIGITGIWHHPQRSALTEAIHLAFSQSSESNRICSDSVKQQKTD